MKLNDHVEATRFALLRAHNDWMCAVGHTVPEEDVHCGRGEGEAVLH